MLARSRCVDVDHTSIPRSTWRVGIITAVSCLGPPNLHCRSMVKQALAPAGGNAIAADLRISRTTWAAAKLARLIRLVSVAVRQRALARASLSLRWVRADVAPPAPTQTTQP